MGSRALMALATHKGDKLGQELQYVTPGGDPPSPTPGHGHHGPRGTLRSSGFAAFLRHS